MNTRGWVAVDGQNTLWTCVGQDQWQDLEQRWDFTHQTLSLRELLERGELYWLIKQEKPVTLDELEEMGL